MAARNPRLATKLQETCDSLSRLARQKGPGAKLPTVLELRQQLGVGVNTLTEALAELEAQKLITRRHGSGIWVSPEVERTIALLCDPALLEGGTSPFWSRLLEQVHARASQEHERLELHLLQGWNEADPWSAGVRRALEAHEFSGVLALGLNETQIAFVRTFEVPLVAYGGHGDYKVGNDNYGTIVRATQELARRGARRIGLWQPCVVGRALPREVVLNGPLRLFQEALASAGAPYHPELTWIGSLETPLTRASKTQQGYDLARAVFAQERAGWPDALFVADDMMTVGVLRAFDELSVRAGRDLTLATQTNTHSALIPERAGLILFEDDPNALVSTLFSTLHSLMRGEDAPREQWLPSQMRVVE